MMREKLKEKIGECQKHLAILYTLDPNTEEWKNTYSRVYQKILQIKNIRESMLNG